MLKILNIQITEQMIEKIINEFNSIVPKGCNTIKIHENWHTGFEIKSNNYSPPIKKICKWNQNYLLPSGKYGLSYSDTIILYLSFQIILGKDNVKFT